MIRVDTSAWIEFLRHTGSAVCVAVDRLFDDDLAIRDAVSLEVLAAARDDRNLLQLRGLPARATVLPTTPADDEATASMYRSCRAGGTTVRKLPLGPPPTGRRRSSAAPPIVRGPGLSSRSAIVGRC